MSYKQQIDSFNAWLDGLRADTELDQAARLEIAQSALDSLKLFNMLTKQRINFESSEALDLKIQEVKAKNQRETPREFIAEFTYTSTTDNTRADSPGVDAGVGAAPDSEREVRATPGNGGEIDRLDQ